MRVSGYVQGEAVLHHMMPIEYFEYTGRRGHYGKITEKQGTILRTFRVNLPLEAWPKSIREEIMKENERE